MTRLSVLFLFALPLVGCDSAADPEKPEGEEAGGEVGGGVGGEGADGGIGGEGGDGGADAGGADEGGEGGDGGADGGDVGGDVGGSTGGGSGADADFIDPGEPAVPTDEWAAAVLGATWVFHPDSGEPREPAALGPLLDGLFDTRLAVQVLEVDGTRLRLRGAAVARSRDEQDLCAVTGEFEGFPTASGALYGAHALGYLPFSEGLEPLAVEGVELMGTPGPDGLRDLELAGRLHFGLSAGPLSELLGTSDPDEICALLTGFGVDCSACADGRELCMPFWITGIDAEPVDLDLVEVAAPCP